MKEITFKSSVFTPYIKGRIIIDKDFLTIYTPKKFGFIPLGQSYWRMPIDQLSSTGYFPVSRVKVTLSIILYFILCIFLMILLSLLGSVPTIIGIIICIIVFFKILKKFRTGLHIVAVNYRNFTLYCSMTEENKMYEACGEIDDMMRLYRDDRNLRLNR